MSAPDRRSSLLPGVSQYEVDFVIPRLGVDVPVGIDPFLLYKSRDPEYRGLHQSIIAAFNAGIQAVQRGELQRAKNTLDFPEVPSIGLGYSRNSKRGSGVGVHLTELILETLLNSPALRERGVRHVEEMQLVSAGIGPDRISDIAGNLVKRFLIGYTQRQCEIWKIPLRSRVPISHIYDPKSGDWEDSYEDLPISPIDESPILLVPRRVVRVLPWINYDDFLRTEFRSYLAARKRAHKTTGPQGVAEAGPRAKTNVVTLTRKDVTLVEAYVRLRERQSSEAQPSMDYIDDDACKEARGLASKLGDTPPGREHANEYQHLVLQILNFLFNPELIDGEPEIRTIDGTERRDLIFTNDSDEPFWDYVRVEHSGILVMFEAKNKVVLELADINQTATYLGDRVGRLGVIVSREAPPETIVRKTFSVWNDSVPNRKVILTLSDADLRELLELRCKNGSPTKWMQKRYRRFRTSVQ